MSRRISTTFDGALAASAQMAAGELAAALLPGGRSPITGLGKTLIDATPGPGVDMVVATAETLDKALLRITLVGGFLGLGAICGARIPSTRGGAAVLAGAALAAGAAGASRRDSSTASSLVAGVAGGLAGVGSHLLLRGDGSAEARRSLALAVAVAAASATALRAFERIRFRTRRAEVALPTAAIPAEGVPKEASFDIAGLTPLFTPPESFYVTDVQIPVPRVDPRAWRLRVHGMVEHELEFSLDQILGMDLVELDATLVCVHNPVGGPRIGTAHWLGLPVNRILEQAGVIAGAEQLVARSVDGFTAGIPLDHIESGAPALLAVGMDGEPLPAENGFPARMLLPGLWGADANTKWVSELEITTWDAVRDYWDRRGWPRVPSAVRPGSRIDVPLNRALLGAAETTIAGVAWAPPDGVEAVEVSIAEGAWQRAELAAEIAPTMWRQWRLQWRPAAGEHIIRVRTVGRRSTQSGVSQPPYPTGSSGYHEVRVTVAERRMNGGERRGLAAAADDLRGRIALAAMAPVAWHQRGYPPAPRFPAPRSPNAR